MDLVTGGAGFIGSHLVAHLRKNKRRVRVIDAMVPDGPEDALRQEAAVRDWRGVDFVRLDLRRTELVRDALEGVTRVYHLAAIAGARRSFLDPEEVIDANVKGTWSLLQAMEDRRIPQLVHLSSSAVYGQTREGGAREDDPHRPVSPYGATKSAQEALVWAWSTANRGKTAIIRPFSVYGPRQRPDQLVVRFIELATKGRPLAMFGDGAARRDYLHVDDLVDLMVGVAAKLQPGPPLILNAATGEAHRILDLVDWLRAELPRALQVECLPSQPGEPEAVTADVTALRSFGFAPGFRFPDGLVQTRNWLAGQDKIPVDRNLSR
jgi:nucleoside-diphosphate-sugar epimerase